MPYLLDTCTFIWLTSEPNKISSHAKKGIDDSDNLYISDISCLEISIKWSNGKLQLPSTPRVWIEEQIAIWDLIPIEIEREHIYRSAELATIHKDPFDRILIGQALSKTMTIITPDEHIKSYPVSTLW